MSLPWALVLLTHLMGGGATLFAASSTGARHEQVRKSTYDARGVIRSFGKDRAYVNIAHEEIPGFMKAMTMAFDARSPKQLEGLAVGDAVEFTFTVDADGRMLLDAIKKR